VGEFGTYVESRDYKRARAWVRGFRVDAWVPAADVERR
jgi:hypothetical protein